MKKIRVYGDLHANFRFLSTMMRISHDIDEFWIAGDFGYGFPKTFDAPFKPKLPVKFIRGNHDNPAVKHDFKWKGFEYIPDGTIKEGILFIGGAWSIDWKQRLAGSTWWGDEELSQKEMDAIEERIKDQPIHTVITHEAPYHLYRHLHPSYAFPTRTSEFLEFLRSHVLVGVSKPQLWIFGHHHKSLKRTVGKTNFVGLNVAESGDFIDLEVGR